jgi:hypothetical protein
MSPIRWSITLSYTRTSSKVGGVKKETFGWGDMDTGRCSNRQHYHHRNSNFGGPEENQIQASIPVQLVSLYKVCYVTWV